MKSAKAGDRVTGFFGIEPDGTTLHGSGNVLRDGEEAGTVWVEVDGVGWRQAYLENLIAEASSS